MACAIVESVSLAIFYYIRLEIFCLQALNYNFIARISLFKRLQFFIVEYINLTFYI